MIESVTDVQQKPVFEVDLARFRLEGRGNTRFAPSAFASITTEDSRLAVDRFLPLVEPPTFERARKIGQDIVSRCRVDIARHPNSGRAHANLGLALLNEGDIEEAASEFEAALKLEPDQYVAAMSLAKTRLIQGRVDDAATLYERLAIAYEADPAVVSGLADIARRNGDLSRAIQLLQEATRRRPNAIGPRYELGILLLQQGLVKEAISQLKDEVRLDVRAARVHQALGAAYTLAGELRRAKRAFQSALALAPTNADAALGLARVLIGLREREDAISVLTEQLSHADNHDIRELLALTQCELGKCAAAKAHLLRLLSALEHIEIRDGTTKARVLNNLAVCSMRLGESEAAERSLKDSIALAPDSSPIPFRNLALVYLRREQLGAARLALEKSRASFPSDTETLWLLAVVRSDEGDVETAVQDLAASTRSGNASPEMFSVLGGLLADEKRDLSGALQVLTEARARFPSNSRVANNLAYVHLMLGDPVSARRVLESSEQPPEAKVTWTATWGLVHLWEGDLEGGAELYREAAAAATNQGDRKLASKVRQKMHLELARAQVRYQNLDEAARHLDQGLKVRPGKRAYYRDLLELKQSLETKSGVDPIV